MHTILTKCRPLNPQLSALHINGIQLNKLSARFAVCVQKADTMVNFGHFYAEGIKERIAELVKTQQKVQYNYR